MADRILQAFRNNRELQCFVLPEVQTTGKQLGEGSYGSVEELKAKGLVCAGKRLHKALVEQGNAGVEKIVSSFLEECKVTTEGVGVEGGEVGVWRGRGWGWGGGRGGGMQSKAELF